MREINCHFPIKLRITGRPSDAQLDRLGDALTRALVERISFAERTISTTHGEHPAGGFELMREGYDPEREDAAGESYSVSSYDDQGRRRSVPVRRKEGGRRRWRVQKAITIRLQVRKFVEYLERLERGNPSVVEIRSLYPELLDETRPVAVWLVVANEVIALETLIGEVARHIAQFIPEGKKFYHGYTYLEADRRRLLALDEEHKLAELPDISYNPGYFTPEGVVVLRRGGMALFVEMALTEVTQTATLSYGPDLTVSLPLRELGFIINGEGFARLFGVSWENYIAEFGDQMAPLRMLPFFTLRRARFQTLKYLVEQSVSSTVDTHSAYFGNLYLLNQSRLDWLPPASRNQARSVTDDVTLALSESRREGAWEPNWSGAFIYAVVSPTGEELNIARLRPEASRSSPIRSFPPAMSG